jgi:enoyl-CoA hydratase
VSDTAVVRYEVSEAIATITMSRPEVANALNTQLINELDEAFDRAEADPNVRVVILAGDGKHFSAGHDLKVLVGQAEPDEWRKMRDTSEGRFHHEYVMYLQRCWRIHDFPKPTIAAVQGYCVIAGFVLACMCDIIIAAEDAIFWSPAALMAGAGAELLVEPWEFGVRKAKEFMWTAPKLEAAEAATLGLVNKVVPPDELQAAAREMAGRIALVPPVTAQMIKETLNHTWDLMGKRDSWKYHFMVHQWTHSTATALASLERRKTHRNMSDLFRERELGDSVNGPVGE